jgi:hypothetical protein
LAWRLASQPPIGLWRDWMVILTLYTIFARFGSRSQAWPVVTTAVMAFLLGIYVVGQASHTLSVLGIAP